MALNVGSRLGHYDVTALIGEGGMGQVYRATDTTLDRNVALKVLPDAFTADPDRLARFEREAKVLASLNHPNIGAIYGLEKSGDTRALVLELIEGPTLADRIKQGPIPLDEALPIAKQIAEALEAAHEAGVIHRDLKPANIKVRDDGTVKVLDFGLAKALDPNPEGDPSQSPTLTAAATQMGVIMGTAAYMSPEQARGKPTDRRADIWAFGAVLFEMLTGKRAFEGEDVSVTLADVIRAEPAWDRLPESLPPSLQTYLRRCLEKDPAERVQAIGDMRLAMGGAFETPVRQPSAAVDARDLRVWQRPVPLVAALGLMAVAGLAVWTASRPEPIAAPDLMQFVVSPPQSAPLSLGGARQDLAISPDGTRIIYKGTNPQGTVAQLNLRRLDQLDTTPLRGGEGGVGPFFSPDGEWVGFVDFNGGTTLQKVSIFGGPPVTLAESANAIYGATWGMDDQIIFGTFGSGLFRVPDGGGEPEALTALDPDDSGHYWPASIPGREAVVFVVATGPPLTTGQLAVLALDTGEVTRLGLAGVSPRYSSTGHLVYAAENGSVRAVPFDAASLDVTGNPVPLIEGVTVKGTGAANFSLSDEGRLVYARGAGGAGFQRSLVWVDRDGHEETIDAPPRAYWYPRVSPDGTRVALDLRDQESDIWVWNVAGETLTRLTFDAAVDGYGHWTPDGEQIVFASERGEAAGIYTKPADGTGTATLLIERLDDPRVNAVTPDGTLVIVRVTGADRRQDLVTVPLDGDAGVETLVSTEFNERNAAISLTACGSPSSPTSRVSRRSTCVRSRTWRLGSGKSRRGVAKTRSGLPMVGSCSSCKAHSSWPRRSEPTRPSRGTLLRCCSAGTTSLGPQDGTSTWLLTGDSW